MIVFYMWYVFRVWCVMSPPELQVGVCSQYLNCLPEQPQFTLLIQISAVRVCKFLRSKLELRMKPNGVEHIQCPLSNGETE